jgi:hypothetical protein
MELWTYTIMQPFGLRSFMAKLDKKPIDKPAPDPKPKEASGHPSNRN